MKAPLNELLEDQPRSLEDQNAEKYSCVIGQPRKSTSGRCV